MDYKHRVPGYRARRSLRFSKPWVVAVGGIVIVVVTARWLFSGDAEDVAVPAEPPPPRTTQLPAPPIPPQKPLEEKKPVKGEEKTAKKNESTEAKASASPGPGENAQKAVPPPKPPEPRFSFYKILPEKEVIIAENDIKNMKQEERLGNQPAGVTYLLQVGSFQHLADAEKLKARLSQLKVKSRIETVKIDNAAWYRVKVGPFGSLVDADRTRAYLRSFQIDSVIEKAKGQP